MTINKGIIKKIIFIISISIAVFFAIKQIGKEFVLPFPNELKLQSPTDFYMDYEGASALIDSSNEKIIFIDDEQKVVTVENLTGNSFISKAYSVTRDDNYFYVLGEKYERNTNLVTNRRIVKYDLTGENPSVLCDVSKDMTDTVSKQKLFTDGNKFICVDRVALGDDTKECRVSMINIEEGEAKYDIRKIDNITSILDAAYSPQEDVLYILDYENHVLKFSENKSEMINLDNKRHAGAVGCLSNGVLVLCDVCSGDIYTTDGKIYSGNPVYNLFVNKETIFGSSYINDQTMVILDSNTDDKTIVNAFKYSFLYELNAIMVFVSIVYLLIVFLVFIFRFLSKRKEGKKDSKSKTTLVMVLGILAALGVALFYSYNMKNQMYEDMKSELILENKFLSEVYNDYIEDNTEFGQASSFEEALNEISKRSKSEHELFKNYIKAADEQNKFGSVFVFERVGDRFVVGFDSSNSFVPGQQLWNVDEQMLASNSEETLILEKFGSFSECSLIPIYDDNNKIIGAVGFGRVFDVFNSQIATTCLEIAMTLFTIFIIIYMGSEEVISLVKSIKKKKKASKGKNTEVYFIQTFTFIKGMLMYMDDVLMVIVANEMLKNLGYDALKVALCISVLTFAKGAGGTLGSILFTVLPQRFSSKRNLVILSIGIVISAALMGGAVLGNRFFLFCLWKFVFMFLACFVYGTVDVMFLNADNEEDKLDSLNGRIKGNISGSVLSVMLGGFLSDLFGYAALYFFIAAVGVLAIILFVLYMNGTTKKEDTEVEKYPKKKINKFDYVKLFFSPAMLIYIFGILAPQMLALGYKNFVFPLYSSEMDLPAYYITNMVVLSKVLSDIILDPVENAMKKVDYWWRIIIAEVLVGLAFIAFVINDTIIWAIIVLVIVTVFDKLINPSLEIVWMRETVDRKLDKIYVGKTVTMIRHIFKSFREAMLSFIQTFSGSSINIVIGLICSIGGAFYALITRNTPMKNGKDE